MKRGHPHINDIDISGDTLLKDHKGLEQFKIVALSIKLLAYYEFYADRR